MEIIDFETLKQNFFLNPNVSLASPEFYQVGGGEFKRLFKKENEQRIFSTIPEQFLLTLNRFEVSKLGCRAKVYTETEIPLQLILTPNETGKDINKYELVTIIEHIGNQEHGNFVHYQKFNNQWIMLKNVERSLLSEDEIKKVLSGNNGIENTSYLHFYVKTKELKKEIEMKEDKIENLKRPRSNSNDESEKSKRSRVE